MNNNKPASEDVANAARTGLGRVQRLVLNELAAHSTRTTAQLAEAIYKKSGVLELNSVLRAIRQLSARGFSLTSTRRGRVNASGYVLEWRQMQ